MPTLQQVLDRITTITFDCYGTLIDWREGLTNSFSEMFGPDAERQRDDLFRAYVDTEAELEAGVYMPYREILAIVAKRLARRVNFNPSGARMDRLAEMLPHWPPFVDTNEALARLNQRFRLGILSNIDRDLFAATARQFTVEFDFVITAEDVRAYKPALPHFEMLYSKYTRKTEHLHVAQSLFHDGVPADKTDVAFVWINRYKDANETSARPIAQYRDLASFADAVCP